MLQEAKREGELRRGDYNEALLKSGWLNEAAKQKCKQKNPYVGGGSMDPETLCTHNFLHSAPHNASYKMHRNTLGRCHDTYEACNLNMISHRL